MRGSHVYPLNSISMKTPDRLLAEKLLQISAIQLQPENPFIWGSGWNSPIYTDNRKVLSYPDVRNFIKVELARIILENFPEVQAIAAVANGAISFGVLVADLLGLPFAYVRSEPKDHGLENIIEGNLKPGAKVVIIEDLVSTGGSSVKVAENVRMAGCEVIGMTAVFTYEFPMAIKRFRDANITLVPLSTYSTMLEVAEETDYIPQSAVRALQEWRKDPASWVPVDGE